MYGNSAEIVPQYLISNRAPEGNGRVHLAASNRMFASENTRLWGHSLLRRLWFLCEREHSRVFSFDYRLPRSFPSATAKSVLAGRHCRFTRVALATRIVSLQPAKITLILAMPNLMQHVDLFPE